jgi:CBS domain containing-hemolysin-like protein
VDCRRAGSPYAGRPPPARRSLIDTALGLLAVLLLIVTTGVFVAAEFALVAVDRSRIEREASEGKRAARTAAALLHRLSFHLSGAQLGITVTSLLLGFIAEPTVAELLEAPLAKVVGERSAHGLALAVALALVTVVSMVASELVPKNLAIARPMRSALVLAGPIRVYGLVFGPVIRFLNNAANWAVRRLGIEPQEELASVRSLEELELLIRSSGEEGTLDPQDVTLLTRTIRFGNKTAADALVPRLQMATVGRDDTVADLVAIAVGTGFSRFPVYGTDLDDIVGVVHVKDVYRLPVASRQETSVAEVMHDPFVVPETRDLESLLVALREQGTHLAVVVDEYGGTAGLITLEDLLEEIVGEIDDEYDPAPELLTVVEPSGTFVVPGSHHPDEVFELTGFEMPEGEYETLAGFVLDRLGHIPEAGEEVVHEGWTIEVVEMDRLRIATVRLSAPSRDGDRS